MFPDVPLATLPCNFPALVLRSAPPNRELASRAAVLRSNNTSDSSPEVETCSNDFRLGVRLYYTKLRKEIAPSVAMMGSSPLKLEG